MSEDDRIDLSAFMDDYLNDAREGFHAVNTALLSLEKNPRQPEPLAEIFRNVHSLKSSSAMLGFDDISTFAHTCEDFLDRLRQGALAPTQDVIDVLFEATDTLEAMVKARAGGEESAVEHQQLSARIGELMHAGPSAGEDRGRAKKPAGFPHIEKSDTVRVNRHLLDAMFDLVGELIITKNRIENIVSAFQQQESKAVLASLDHIAAGLQENISAARLVPVDEVFRKFPRMVHDLARNAGKEVEFEMEGVDLEIDKGILDAISEPLIHLLRNAVDHGIEPARTRLKRGKPVTGSIKLEARRSEEHILIDVADDGGGIDLGLMRKIAASRGLVKPEEAGSLEDREVLDLLFEPGFSSSAEISDVSGRGVGLDIVRKSASDLGGTMEVETAGGRGSRFLMRLPLTTAVMQAIMVEVDGRLYAIPSDIVEQTVRISPDDIREIYRDQVMVFRGEVIPFIVLSQALNLPQEGINTQRTAVIVNRGGKLMAVGVDAVVDQAESIIKQLDPIARKLKGFSGGTILGDGRVVLLLDVPGLLI